MLLDCSGHIKLSYQCEWISVERELSRQAVLCNYTAPEVVHFLYQSFISYTKVKCYYIYYLYIYLLVCLDVCLFVCLFISNKRQNSCTDPAKKCCGTSHDPREGLWLIKISKSSLQQNSIFIKFWIQIENVLN